MLRLMLNMTQVQFNIMAFSGNFCATEDDLTSGVESLTSPLLDSTFLSEEAVLGLF